jgi:hypothetical protein
LTIDNSLPYFMESTNKFELSDFALSLAKITAVSHHIFVNSGYTTVQPRSNTVMGVNEFHAPPFAVPEFGMLVGLEVNGHFVKDTASRGKGDVGLLYSGGIWLPHQIERHGTYHHFVKGQLISLGVTSKLVPTINRAGFVLQIELTNRGDAPVKIEVQPQIQPGIPRMIPLDQWLFSTPKLTGETAVSLTPDTWQNNEVKLHLLEENKTLCIEAGDTAVAAIAVAATQPDELMQPPDHLSEWIDEAVNAWQNRLNAYLKNVPSLTSNIPGLRDYYYRSLVSGLVCIWENPAFLLNPHVSTSGMDGGSACSYLWDIGGYAPNMLSLMLGEAILPIARQFKQIDLQKFYAFTPSGDGIGVRYAYSPWSFTKLVTTIAAHLGVPDDLYQALKTLLLEEEKQADRETLLVDYGTQHNLLEMRGAGYEHIVASPNAERAWSLRQLAELAKLVDDTNAPITEWRVRAEQIIESIRTELWDEERGWFKAKYPNGHEAFVYSVQIFDAFRAGACKPEMAEQLLSHLREGAFLGEYGVHSISQEDTTHFELNDPDWSGGGAYSGEGPQLAMALFEQKRPFLATNVLQRHFWMGQHLPYFPQEHDADKPFAPPHKRANIIAGLTGAEAILHGLVGFQPQLNGTLWLEPQLVADGKIRISGYGFRNHVFTVELSQSEMMVWQNGRLVYRGNHKKVQLL